jgi:hypothetical protein
MGICDDWSYVRSAQVLAQTGHIHYNGWATAMIGWQLYLGALLIKIFGFSFTAPRIGTLLIALFTAYLMQRTLVRFGISESNAVLGTLIFVLSPLFMPLSATMMSDIPGFFSVLACLYGCIRALQSIRDRHAISWLCFAVFVNAICGTSRQIAWLGILILVPCTLWLLRFRRTVLLYGAAVTTLGFVFVFVTLRWFNAQPYTVSESLVFPPFHLWAWSIVGRWYVKSLVEIGLLLFPLSIPYIAAALRFSPRKLAGMAAIAALFLALVYCLGRTYALRSLFYPFINDWVGPHALYEGSGLMSAPPTVLGFTVLHCLSAIALVSLLCIFATILLDRPIAIRRQTVGTLTWHQLAILFGPLTFVHFVLLSPRGMYAIFDRYLLVPLFLAMVCVLLYSQQRLKARWPGATYFAVTAIAFYGIVSTHNTFALDRARVVLANEILATGVLPSHVDLGMEMNGWYELQISTYVNDYRIRLPAGAYHVYTEPHRSGCHELSLFGFFPHLAPRYGIAFEPNLCDGPAPFAPVGYSTWPLRHPTTLYVVKYPPPWQSAIDVSNPTAPDSNR